MRKQFKVWSPTTANYKGGWFYSKANALAKIKDLRQHGHDVHFGMILGIGKNRRFHTWEFKAFQLNAFTPQSTHAYCA